MTAAEFTELIKEIANLLIGFGAAVGAVMGVINYRQGRANHQVIQEVKAQTNGLIEQGRKDARAEGRQEQKDERAASDANEIAAR